MADEKTEAQLQRELFEGAMAPDTEPSVPQPKPGIPSDDGIPAPGIVQTPPPTPEVPPAPPLAEPPEAAIPSWRLREEAEARRAAEDRARALEDRLNQIAAHLQQQAATQKQPDFFDDPNAATQAAVVRALQPFLQEYGRTAEEN